MKVFAWGWAGLTSHDLDCENMQEGVGGGARLDIFVRSWCGDGEAH
jgi:hypothetical protein